MELAFFAFLIAALPYETVLPLQAAPAFSDSSNSRDVPPPFVVVKGAQNVVSRPDVIQPDRISVSYDVRAAYPAAGVVAEIRTRLEGSGWKPLPRQWANPMKLSSLRVGWSSHAIWSPRPEGESFGWNAQWRNPAGDLIVYTLMYKSGPPKADRKSPKPDNDNLRVLGLLIPMRFVSLKVLPASLIVLHGAREVSAWRDQFPAGHDTTKVAYILAAPRPPSELMSTLDARLGELGWVSAAEERPPLWPAQSPTFARQPGWTSRPSRKFGGSLEWRANWRNQAGDTIMYTLTYDSALPPPSTETSQADSVDFYVEGALVSKRRT